MGVADRSNDDSDVGTYVGKRVRKKVGLVLGRWLGRCALGQADTSMDGFIVGFDMLGVIVGTSLGDLELEGYPVGEQLGQTVGLEFGSTDGSKEGV